MLTLPQIELMQSDLPHTLYVRKKKDGNKSVSKADYDDAVKAYMANRTQAGLQDVKASYEAFIKLLTEVVNKYKEENSIA